MKTNVTAFLVLAGMPTMASATLRRRAQNNVNNGVANGRPRPCTTNSDCGDDKYCARGQCLTMGACETEWDCRNPNNTYPVIECTGPLVCNQNNQCGRECGPICPDGTNGVPCLMNPCTFAENFCSMEFTQCTNDFCGGCNALVFNETGNHELCSLPTKFVETQNCTSSADCGESKFCSAGVCTESGKCSSDADCFNPDNVYATGLCVGPISCDLESGQCGRTCSDSNCPADKPQVECLASTCGVLAETCSDEVANCVDYSCGDCGAFAFDKAGFQVCNEPAPKSCNSTTDCGDFEYCSAGICTEAGKCSSDADCFNPDNVYASILCVGPISCNSESGRCGRTCSDSNCPADKPQVECPVLTCKTLAGTCQEEISSCVDYSCGECGAFAFDKAGYQVCNGSEGDACNSADDCAEDEYCAGGKCLADGKCATDIDCFNPTNMYPMILCVGALSCQDNGSCGVKCGASNCPNGKKPTNCLVEPCSVPPSCQEPWEYCINDYCHGGCDAILLDAAGNEVTCTPV